MKLLKNRFLKINPGSFKRSISTYNETKVDIKSWNEIPGPSSLPLFGQLPNFLPGGSLHKFVGYPLHKELHRRYGNIVKIDAMFNKPPMLYIFDAEGGAQVLRGETYLPIRGAQASLAYYRHVYKRDILKITHEKTGLFSDQGEIWKEFRTAMNPILMNPKTVQSYEPIVDDVAQDMIKRLKNLRDEKNTIRKFGYEMNLWSLESIAAVALGDRLNCFDPTLTKHSPVHQLIERISDFFVICYLLDFKLNLWPLYPTKNFKKAMKNYRDIEELCEYFINQSRIKLKHNELPYSGVLEKVLAYDESMGVLMVSDMLFGGVDTSSNTILAILYLLAKNPDKQQKLREEVMSNTGSRTYLRACMKEGMRMMPASTGNMRITTKEYHILGYKIPKHTPVSIGHQLMCEMDDHYPKSNEYLPERWIVEKDNPIYYGSAHPFTYSPFGFGVRSCIGRRIVELELEVFILRLLENFHIGWDGPPVNIKHTFVNALVEPFYFTFQDV